MTDKVQEIRKALERATPHFECLWPRDIKVNGSLPNGDIKEVEDVLRSSFSWLSYLLTELDTSLEHCKDVNMYKSLYENSERELKRASDIYKSQLDAAKQELEGGDLNAQIFET